MHVLRVLLVVTVLAGCKPETARPGPAEDPEQQPTISSAGPAKPAEPTPDAATDGEQMSPDRVREPQVESTGILKVLKDNVGKEKTPNVLSPGRDFGEEEMEALEEALGTVEKKPPPPLESP